MARGEIASYWTDNGSGDDDERRKKSTRNVPHNTAVAQMYFSLSLSVGGPPSENRHLTPLDLGGDGRRVWEKVAEVGICFFCLVDGLISERKLRMVQLFAVRSDLQIFGSKYGDRS